MDDEAAVGGLLSRCYSKLLAEWYSEDLLTQVLPLMTRAQPKLLASPTYYVVERGDALIGCGGWTLEGPGGREPEGGLGHVRHFATDPQYLRRGIARSILSRCISDARGQGLERLECHSTLAAESFYRAQGFRTREHFDVRMGPNTAFPAVCMILEL